MRSSLTLAILTPYISCSSKRVSGDVSKANVKFVEHPPLQTNENPNPQQRYVALVALPPE